MSRVEFMNELRALLWELSAEEREEAMQYYNDYFDDAGVENEAAIISELGSPKRVAETIKAGLAGADDESSEYRETGYKDIRFEHADTPATHEEVKEAKKAEQEERQKQSRAQSGYRSSEQTYGQSGYRSSEQTYGQDGCRSGEQTYGQGGYRSADAADQQAEGWDSRSDYTDSQYRSTSGKSDSGPWTSNTLKIILIVLIVVVGAPIVIPVGIGIIAAIFGILVAIAAVAVGLLCAGIGVVIAGMAIIGAGLSQIFHSVPTAFALMGAGLLVAVLGVLLTVLTWWLAFKIIPPVFRWIVELCRKPFQKRRNQV